MLLLEVKVPALCGRYDFELEESASVEVLIREISAVICQKERCQCFEGAGGLRLYSQELERQLLPGEVLGTCGVRNGQSLILL